MIKGMQLRLKMNMTHCLKTEFVLFLNQFTLFQYQL